MDMSSLMLGGPTDVAGFERELTGEMMAAMTAAAHARGDVGELIARALKHRCNPRNRMEEALHMHLRLKIGANADPHGMTRRELAELAELVAARGSVNGIVQRLANFYARIAMLRARIEAILRSSSAADPNNYAVHGSCGKYEQQLLAAHAKNEESLREKWDQNRRELDRIMHALFQESNHIRPDLTEADLLALETQVEHIAERGCTAQELRRVKIVEALLEQRQLDALLNQWQLHM
jgi:hypothetical protein